MSRRAPSLRSGARLSRRALRARNQDSRDPKNDPEASISPESALMYTQCTRNMLGKTFVSHTKHWKTPQHRQHRENKKITLFHCHIGKSQLPSPFTDPKNDPEASISTGSALMYTHCTRNMLGTTVISHTQPCKTTQHRQNREKQRKSRCFTVT